MLSRTVVGPDSPWLKYRNTSFDTTDYIRRPSELPGTINAPAIEHLRAFLPYNPDGTTYNTSTNWARTPRSEPAAETDDRRPFENTREKRYSPSEIVRRHALQKLVLTAVSNYRHVDNFKYRNNIVRISRQQGVVETFTSDRRSTPNKCHQTYSDINANIYGTYENSWAPI